MSCNPVDPEEVAILKAFSGIKADARREAEIDFLAMKLELQDEPEPPKEMVNSPAHYNSGKIEVIDYIEDQNLGFNLGNCIKYISRSSHKGSPITDLKKALWYLEREIALRQK